MSNTFYEVMEQKVSFYSENLLMEKNYNIFLPPGYTSQQKYPVLYMLHGRTGDEDAWTTNGLFKVARQMITEEIIKPIIIVTPDMDNSGGFNWFDSDLDYHSYEKDGISYGQYENYVIEDLIYHIDTTYYTDATKNARYIGGCSMGGLAALHIAFLHTDMFCKVGGHSPALILENHKELFASLYPYEEKRMQRDPIKIAEYADLLSIDVYLDCGSEDEWGLYEGTQVLYELLKEKQVESQYHLNEGTHEREYWNAHLEDYLLFYAGIE